MPQVARVPVVFDSHHPYPMGFQLPVPCLAGTYHGYPPDSIPVLHLSRRLQSLYILKKRMSCVLPVIRIAVMSSESIDMASQCAVGRCRLMRNNERAL